MTDDAYSLAAQKLSSLSAEERREAVLALLQLKDPRSIDLLAGVVSRDQDVDVRYYARKAYYLLRDVLPENLEEPFLQLPDGISFDDLDKLLQDANPRIRAEGLKLSSRMDPGSVAPLLRKIIPGETHPQLQSAMITSLGQIGNANDIPLLAGFLAAAEPRMRANAVEALAKIGGNDAMEHVVPLLRDPDNRVRANAVKTLQDLETIDMMKILRSMAMSPQVAFRDSAIFTLQRFKLPVAAKIMAHLAANDPLPSLREKAHAALAGMAKTNEAARELLEKLDDPEAAADEKIPAMIPVEGSPEPVQPDGPTSPGDPAQPRMMIVPGVSRKLDKEISSGDAAQRELGLRQVAAILTPEHLPYLLYRFEREEDPRISSYLLSLIGKTKVAAAYAVVIKRFRHPDTRVRANAIEAAMAIDPLTTPDRIVGYLEDVNNRIRANSILAWANRPNFDPLVYIQGLVENPDPTYRRSALFVISRLRRPTFLPLLEMLAFDDDMEVRHLTYQEVQKYEKMGVKGAAELSERAGKMISRETKGAGQFDQDFHTAMIAMRTSAPPKRTVLKQEKTASEELGEQLLGRAGLKKAGAQVKNIKEQAKVAREKVAVGLTKTRATIASLNWSEQLLGLARLLALILLLILHGTRAFGQFPGETPYAYVTIGSAVLALLGGSILLALRRSGLASLLALILLAVPFALSQAQLIDDAHSRSAGSASPVGGAEIASGAGFPSPASTSADPAGIPSHPTPSKASGPLTATHPPKPADEPQNQATPTAAIRLLEPVKGAVLAGEFVIKAAVTGEARAVDFFIDENCIKSFPEPKKGIFTHTVLPDDTFPVGRRTIKAKVTDSNGRQYASFAFVEFLQPIPGVEITSPASGAVFWRDSQLAIKVKGGGYSQVEFHLDDAVIGRYKAEPDGGYEYPVPMGSIPEGPHTFHVAITMEDGRQASSSVDFRVQVPVPVIRFRTPQPGQSVFGAVTIDLAVDSGYRETAIRQVTWFVDGLPKKRLATPPWVGVWDANDMPVGPHELSAVMENELGKRAGASITVELIQPAFSATIKGIPSGGVLKRDAHASVEVVNETTGTTIEKVVLTLDGKQWQEIATAPFGFPIRVNEMPTGVRKLTAEVFRSDGRTGKASVSFVVDVPSRRVAFFSAQDAAGKSLSALEAAKIPLVVKEDGTDVGSFTLELAGQGPLSFGLLVDVSDSMKSDQKLAKAKQALSAFLDEMRAEDRAFLVKFADVPERVLDFTGDRTKLIQEIEFFTAKGGSALLDAIAKGVETAVQVPGYTFLVLLTDGGDESFSGQSPVSNRSNKEVLDMVKRQNGQWYFVSLAGRATVAAGEGEDHMRELAEISRGRFFPAGSAAELPTILLSIMREIRGHIRLTYSSPSGPPDGNRHSLEISAPTRPEVKFQFRPDFQARDVSGSPSDR
jgi:VWFA-related protein